jgi:hypothetical protein
MLMWVQSISQARLNKSISQMWTTNWHGWFSLKAYCWPALSFSIKVYRSLPCPLHFKLVSNVMYIFILHNEFPARISFSLMKCVFDSMGPTVILQYFFHTFKFCRANYNGYLTPGCSTNGALNRVPADP